MAKIRKRVINTNTGKVLYEGVIASGSFEDMYKKLLDFARRFVRDHFYPDGESVVFPYIIMHRGTAGAKASRIDY